MIALQFCWTACLPTCATGLTGTQCGQAGSQLVGCPRDFPPQTLSATSRVVTRHVFWFDNFVLRAARSSKVAVEATEDDPVLISTCYARLSPAGILRNEMRSLVLSSHCRSHSPSPRVGCRHLRRTLTLQFRWPGWCRRFGTWFAFSPFVWPL